MADDAPPAAPAVAAPAGEPTGVRGLNLNAASFVPPPRAPRHRDACDDAGGGGRGRGRGRQGGGGGDARPKPTRRGRGGDVGANAAMRAADDVSRRRSGSTGARRDENALSTSQSATGARGANARGGVRADFLLNFRTEQRDTIVGAGRGGGGGRGQRRGSAAASSHHLHHPHEVRSIHWFPYDRVGVVNADP